MNDEAINFIKASLYEAISLNKSVLATQDTEVLKKGLVSAIAGAFRALKPVLPKASKVKLPTNIHAGLAAELDAKDRALRSATSIPRHVLGKSDTEKAWFGEPERHAEVAARRGASPGPEPKKTSSGKSGLKSALKVAIATAIAAGGIAALTNPIGRALVRQHAGKIAASLGAKKIGQTAFTNTIKSGGTTISVFGKVPKKGYALSIYKGRELKVPAKQITSKHFKDYIKSNKDVLSQKDHFVGSWHNTDDGYVYLDVSVVKNNLDDAMKLARENKQLAVFDLGNLKEIKVD